MSALTISTVAALGPLTIELVSLANDGSRRQPTLLSSAKDQVVLHDIEPGDYAVIGTRSTGETIVQRVTIGESGATVEFATAGRSPHDFLDSAAARGLVPSLPANAKLTRDSIKSLETPLGEPLLGITGATGQTLRALIAQQATTRSLKPAGALAEEGAIEHGYRLRQWTLRNRQWACDQTPDFELRPDYLHVQFTGDEGNDGERICAHAIGLVNHDDFGPIIVIPHFYEGISVTYSADALLPDAAERVTNPSAAKTPVAIAVPHLAWQADLLAATTAPSFPGAIDLWRQIHDKSVAERPRFQDRRYVDEEPGATLMAAHFLARYMPNELETKWLELIASEVDYAADGPLLLAMHLSATGTSADGKSIQTLIGEALYRPTCLFGRARSLLTQMARLYAIDPIQIAPNLASPGSFLNVAADAGGLEAFWGTAPTSPGRSASSSELTLDRGSAQIRMVGGLFAQ